jgi:hypothetical protein
LVAADLPTVPIAQGGTNLTALGTANQVLGVNSGTSGLEYKTITAGSNVTVTHGANSITIASTGGGGGTPAGSDTQVQYNNASAFGATSNFIVDVGGTNTALVRATSPSNTKPALRLQSNGASQTAAVLAVTDSSIDVFRVMRDGTINDATWGGNTIPTTKGGTGLTALGSALQVLRTNSGASAMEWASILNGSAGDLAIGSSQTSSFTATVGTLHPINLSGVVAHLTVTFPATPSAGDVFGYIITNTNATYECAANRNGNTIRGGTSVDEYRIWQVGEYVVWRFINSTWHLVQDGRIISRCAINRTTSQTISDASSSIWTANNSLYDSGGMSDLANGRIVARRKGIYRCFGNNFLNVSGSYYFECGIFLNGTSTRIATAIATAGSIGAFGIPSASPICSRSLDRGDYVNTVIYQNTGGSRTTNELATNTTFLAIEEVLQ